MAKNLRTVHVHRPVGLETDDIPVVPRDRILTLLQHCNWPLRHIGFNSRVHQVRLRLILFDGDPCLLC